MAYLNFVSIFYPSWLLLPPNDFAVGTSGILKRRTLPGDFRSWESPQTLPAHFIGCFEHVERFRNLKFAV